jgi:PTH1 family peptidyl-tRNA hydrolase
LSFKLLVGLGNPTSQYEGTRHNAGFWFLDGVAQEFRAHFSADTRFHGWTAQADVAGAKVLLLKPSTYMNRSGLAVASAARYFKIAPGEILVAHDELDLPPGVARLKRGGGHGGHNGLRDIIAALGGNDFYRLRLGIGHPGERAEVVGYVLHAPSKIEEDLIQAAIRRAIPRIPDLMAGRVDVAMKQLHTEAAVIRK